MDNVINFKDLGNNWYEGKLAIDGHNISITGICEKNPANHLQSAYRFFVQGGMRAQCVFNQHTSCHLIVMRRDDAENDNIIVEVVKRIMRNYAILIIWNLMSYSQDQFH
ncbi:MAG: hypothetical protein AMJ55_07695 [Gammaproteobacteria bacterium SG8_15]|nr:MAG: hypothetical protein AMJ55_07695 [Gammaproteobacteria bacterium SG8_15]